MSLNFRKPLKLGYGTKQQQTLGMAKKGFVRDNDLSNHNQQVYYRPSDKKVLFNVTGTHNISDVGTDFALAFGGLKKTGRYKEADKALKAAKEKYGTGNTTITGHSLGGSIAGYLGSKKEGDKVFTLDKGATVGQKVRGLEKGYRTSGDVVSLLNAGSKHMTTLKNEVSGSGKPGLGAANKLTGFAPADILKAHDVNNVKSAGIFVD